MSGAQQRSKVERESRGIRTRSDPKRPHAKASRCDRFGIGLVLGLTLAGFACLGSYLLGVGYEWRGWLFVAPFLSAAGFALAFGASMRPVHGLVASAVLAAALIVAFGLGLDAGYMFSDPAIGQGYETWVMLSLIAVPMAWFIGVVVRYRWPRTRRGRAGPP